MGYEYNPEKGTINHFLIFIECYYMKDAQFLYLHKCLGIDIREKVTAYTLAISIYEIFKMRHF